MRTNYRSAGSEKVWTSYRRYSLVVPPLSLGMAFISPGREPARWQFPRNGSFASGSGFSPLTPRYFVSRPDLERVLIPQHNFCNRAKVRVTVWTSLREPWRGRLRVLAWLFRSMRLTNCVHAFWWLLAKVLRHDLKRASLYLRSNWTSFVSRINSQSFV